MTISGKSVVAMINARGGSKGIPRKNIRPLGKKPLIAWSIELAARVPELDRTIVSTDDREIAEVARRHGADVPFMRPAELASDTSVQLDTIRYNIETLEASGPRIDIIVLLQPTSPFREPGDVSGCLELMEATDADTVITVADVNKYHPLGIWRMGDPASPTALSSYLGTTAQGYNRQTLDKLYWRTGSVYVMRRHVVMDGRAIYGERVHGYQIDHPRSFFNLDSLFDWELAEAWLAHKPGGA